MGSRLLALLDAQIAAETDPVRNACLRARRAIHWARQGQHEAVRAEAAALREAFGTRPHAEVTAWISLAEAVNSFFSHPGPQALDRLKRSQVLARAIGHVELQALCAAWLAHFEFNASHMDAMVEHAAEALRMAAPEHHAALARASLVVADAYHYAGRYDIAKDWYTSVRLHALAEGDDAMISAMLHNVATFRANNVRVAAVFGEIDAEQASRALLEAESTRNYDTGIGTASLTLFVPLLRAQLLTAMGKYEEALSLFADHVDLTPTQGMSRLLPAYLADMAWCYLRLGNLDRARVTLARALAQSVEESDPDDTASAYARTSQIYATLGDAKAASEFRGRAEDELGRHKATQVALLEKLARAALAVQPVH